MAGIEMTRRFAHKLRRISALIAALAISSSLSLLYPFADEDLNLGQSSRRSSKTYRASKPKKVERFVQVDAGQTTVETKPERSPETLPQPVPKLKPGIDLPKEKLGAPRRGLGITFLAVDRQGQMIPELQLTLEGRSRKKRFPRVQKTLTLGLGESSYFYPLAPGPYMLKVHRAGFAPLRRAIRVDDAITDLGVLTLAPGCHLKGLIEDEQGQRLKLVECKVRGQGENRVIQSDEDGEFFMKDLPEGLYTLDVTCRGFVSETRRRLVIVEETPTTVLVSLKKAFVVTGLVRNSEGKEVVARLEVFRKGRSVKKGRSDASGRFKFLLEAGDYEVVASSKKGAESCRDRLLSSSSFQGDQDLTLTPSLTLKGKVLLVSGEVAKGRRLSLQPLDFRVKTRRGRVNGQGGYLFDKLVPGRYRLRAWHGREDGSSYAEQILSLDRVGQVQNLTLPEAFLFRGRVEDRGDSPLKGVYAIVLENNQRRGFSSVDSEGRFSIKNLPAARYDLFIRKRGSGQVAVYDLDLTKGLPKNPLYVLHTQARIRGRILDPQKRPLSGIMVKVVGVGRLGTVRRRARSGKDGSFSISSLYPGQYRMTAESDRLAIMARKKGHRSIHFAPISIRIEQSKVEDVTWIADWD